MVNEIIKKTVADLSYPPNKSNVYLEVSNTELNAFLHIEMSLLNKLPTAPAVTNIKINVDNDHGGVYVTFVEPEDNSGIEKYIVNIDQIETRWELRLGEGESGASLPHSISSLFIKDEKTVDITSVTVTSIGKIGYVNKEVSSEISFNAHINGEALTISNVKLEGIDEEKRFIISFDSYDNSDDSSEYVVMAIVGSDEPLERRRISILEKASDIQENELYFPFVEDFEKLDIKEDLMFMIWRISEISDSGFNITKTGEGYSI